MTKIYKFKKNICWFLSFICKFGPLIVFTLMGFIKAENSQKLVLGMTTIGSIIIAIIAAMRQIHLKSTVYILMIGLWVALDRLLPFILTIAICTIVDELIFEPLYKRFKEDYYTNKQIDKRM